MTVLKPHGCRVACPPLRGCGMPQLTLPLSVLGSPLIIRRGRDLRLLVPTWARYPVGGRQSRARLLGVLLPRRLVVLKFPDVQRLASSAEAGGLGPKAVAR